VAADVAGPTRQEDVHLIEVVVRKFIKKEQQSQLNPNISLTPSEREELASCISE
jgi:hypothetical protein